MTQQFSCALDVFMLPGSGVCPYLGHPDKGGSNVHMSSLCDCIALLSSLTVFIKKFAISPKANRRCYVTLVLGIWEGPGFRI